MQIRRLKLSGFKSFVEPAELKIETGLTGFVGPNGCGKSNLLEALRWVMGENSYKSMRASGMEGGGPAALHCSSTNGSKSRSVWPGLSITT